MITNLFIAIVDAPLIHQPTWPFVVAVLSGIGFGFLGWRAGHGATLWAIGGASFGLVLSTIACGLANAAAVPYTDANLSRRQLVALIVSVILILAVAALLSLGRIKWGASTRKEPNQGEFGPGPKSGTGGANL